MIFKNFGLMTPRLMTPRLMTLRVLNKGMLKNYLSLFLLTGPMNEN